MFRYADLVMFGLFIGLTYRFFRHLRQKKGVLSFLTDPEEAPALPIPDFSSSGQAVYSIALAVLILQCCLFNSQLRELFPRVINAWEPVLDLVIGVCLTVKILFLTRYTSFQLGCGFCCWFILRWVYFNNHNIWFILGLFFLFGVKDVPLRLVTGEYLILGLCCIVPLGILSVFEVGDLYNIFWGWDGYGPYTIPDRCYFGFTHYNTLGGILLGLSIAWVLWRGQKGPALLDLLVLGISGWFTGWVVGSRAAGLSILFLLAGTLFVRASGSLMQKLPLRLLLSASPLVLGALSAVIPLWSHASVPLLNTLFQKLDHLFTGRLTYSLYALEHYHTRIAGQLPLGDVALDNVYLDAWFFLGPVASAMIWGSACWVIFRLLGQGRSWTAMAFIAACVYGWLEIQFYQLKANPTLLLYVMAVYGRSDTDFGLFEPSLGPSRKKFEKF